VKDAAIQSTNAIVDAHTSTKPFSANAASEQKSQLADSSYGASSVSGPNAERTPTTNDLEIAKTLGRRIAEVAKKALS